MRKTILYFCGSRDTISMRKFSGICAYARRKRWHAKFIEHGRLPLDTYLKIWKPDGVITDDARYRPEHLPTVVLDGDNANGDMTVLYDRRAAARAAAAELCNLDLKNFAFVPPPSEYAWSDDRRDAFVRAISAIDREVAIFPKKRNMSAESPSYQQSLSAWLATLPKPCGLFAANDATADLVLASAALVGIKVPLELTVIGVDDDADICENTFPTLTSIAPAFKEAGSLAAEALDCVIRNDIPGNRTITYGNQGLTRRESTRRIFGRVTDIRKARDLIRREACHGLKARDVLTLVTGSRRRAEIRFKAMVGRSILEEIENARLSQAKKLLTGTSSTLIQIASAGGYVSTSHLRKTFEKRTGMTMGAWRKAHCKIR